MNIKLKHIAASGILAASLVGLPLQAADDNLSDWEIGTVQVGEKVTMKDLKGQVVVFEYWGTR
ncbi:hypothetical protein N9A94_03215 [Akkermansiaceae bacterium]|nr:hypothetical protein [Akkermansiaceae bacterium]MDA7888177.1 hypothetical protein [Akkermansiaceae bacterium]MDB4537691.1 hypothetical protein [Akkermansiaceae bacterium]